MDKKLIKKLPTALIALAVLTLLSVSFTGGEALAFSEVSEREQVGYDRRVDRVEEFVTEGILTKEQGQELLDQIEERDSIEKGVCPEDGPRECKLGLNLRNYLHGEDDLDENRTDAPGFRRGQGGRNR